MHYLHVFIIYEEGNWEKTINMPQTMQLVSSRTGFITNLLVLSSELFLYSKSWNVIKYCVIQHYYMNWISFSEYWSSQGIFVHIGGGVLREWWTWSPRVHTGMQLVSWVKGNNKIQLHLTAIALLLPEMPVNHREGEYFQLYPPTDYQEKYTRYHDRQQ